MCLHLLFVFCVFLLKEAGGFNKFRVKLLLHIVLKCVQCTFVLTLVSLFYYAGARRGCLVFQRIVSKSECVVHLRSLPFIGARVRVRQGALQAPEEQLGFRSQGGNWESKANTHKYVQEGYRFMEVETV